MRAQVASSPHPGRPYSLKAGSRERVFDFRREGLIQTAAAAYPNPTLQRRGAGVIGLTSMDANANQGQGRSKLQ